MGLWGVYLVKAQNPVVENLQWSRSPHDAHRVKIQHVEFSLDSM